jgi:hypothetical protein
MDLSWIPKGLAVGCKSMPSRMGLILALKMSLEMEAA